MIRPLLVAALAIALSLSFRTTAHAATPPTNIALYDLQKNGAVQIGDAILLLNHVGAVGKHGYDYNQDGAITIGDVILLDNHIGQTVPPKWSGSNYYRYAAEPNTTDSGCPMSTSRASQTAAIATGGFGVLRIWAFQGYAQHNGVRDWSQLDDAITSLAFNNMQAVVVLGNNWADCDGPGPTFVKDCGWYQTGYTQQTYAGQTHVQSYRDYVAALVTRYKDDPGVKLYDIMNEPWASTACIHAFFADMTALIKSIDQWAQISLGGNGDGGWDFATENALPNVTMTTFHDYTEPTNPLPSWVQGKITASQQLGKPIYEGEEGVDCNNQSVGCGTPCDESAMATDELAKGRGSIAAGAVGFLSWDFDYNRALGSCAYEYGQTSPRMQVPLNAITPQQPVRVVLAGFSDHPVPAGAVDLACTQWVPAVASWFQSEAGMTFTWTCEAHNSLRPISDFGPQDDCGEGVDLFKFLNLYMTQELGMFLGITQERDALIQVGGGGDAASYYNYSYAQPQPPNFPGGLTNRGAAAVGDWTLTPALTGQPDPCCLTHNIYGTAPCYRTDGGALGHEMLNAFSCQIFNDSTLNTGDPMPALYRNALRDPCNARWLR